MYGKHSFYGEDNPAYGKICITDGISNKRVPKDQLDQYLEEGWRRGMIRRNKNKLDNDKEEVK